MLSCYKCLFVVIYTNLGLHPIMNLSVDITFNKSASNNILNVDGYKPLHIYLVIYVYLSFLSILSLRYVFQIYWPGHRYK